MSVRTQAAALTLAAISLIASGASVHATDIAACRAAVAAADKVALCSIAIRVSHNPRDLERAHNRRGLAYTELRQFDAAISDFDEVIRLNNRIAGYFDNRMNAWRGKGDLAHALADAEETVRLAPGYSFAHRARANVLEDLGRYPDSIADFSTAIEINPADAGLHVERGRVYTKFGDLNAAIRDYTEAMRLNPAERFALKQRGLAYMSLGDTANARADLESFLALQPGDEDATAAVLMLKR